MAGHGSHHSSLQTSPHKPASPQHPKPSPFLVTQGPAVSRKLPTPVWDLLMSPDGATSRQQLPTSGPHPLGSWQSLLSHLLYLLRKPAPPLGLNVPLFPAYPLSLAFWVPTPVNTHNSVSRPSLPVPCLPSYPQVLVVDKGYPWVLSHLWPQRFLMIEQPRMPQGTSECSNLAPMD